MSDGKKIDPESQAIWDALRKADAPAENRVGHKPHGIGNLRECCQLMRDLINGGWPYIQIIKQCGHVIAVPLNNCPKCGRKL